MAGRPHRLRSPFLVHGNTLWFSELMANGILALVLLVLLSVSSVMALKAHAGRSLERRIAALKAERMTVTLGIEELRRELRVLTLLRAVAHGGVNDTMLCRVANLVNRNSGRFGYDPLLLLAVIHVESIFDPSARGRFVSGNESGAIGLMQVKYETASEVARCLNLPAISRSDLLKPEINLLIGVAYLTQLITQFKSFKLGLLAYNQGPVVVMQTLSSGEPLSLEYYRMVLRSYYALKKKEREIDNGWKEP
jgi:hypothetical protein